MAIYLYSQILKLTKYSIKLIEKFSRRHLINFSDVFVIKGLTVVFAQNEMNIGIITLALGFIFLPFSELKLISGSKKSRHKYKGEHSRILILDIFN